MKVQNYEVYIVGGIPVSINNIDGYYSLNHGQTFSIGLINHSYEKCVACVYIENDLMGQPILEAHQRFSLEGKINSGKLFTLYASNSSEAIQVGEQVLTPAEKGLIRVEFYPEKQAPKHYGSTQQCKGVTRGGTCESFTTGVVGLSGNSDQRFESVAFQADRTRGVEITLRLLVDRTMQVDQPTPISSRRNIVPPPVF